MQGSLIRNCPPVKKNFLFLVSGHNWLGAKTKTIFEREAKIETRKDFRDLGKYFDRGGYFDEKEGENRRKDERKGKKKFLVSKSIGRYFEFEWQTAGVWQEFFHTHKKKFCFWPVSVSEVS